MSARRKLGLLLLLALSLRLAWGLSRPTSPASLDALPDQREYLSLARNLLEGRGLGFFDDRFGQWVVAYRTPGYPLMLAICGGDLRVIRTIQAILDTSTVLAVYLLARRLLAAGATRFSGRPALAALLVAINPFLIYFSGLVLSETLFISMLAWGMYLLTDAEARPHRMCLPWIGGIVLLAASVHVRPSAAVLALVLPGAAIWANRGCRDAYQPRRILQATAAVLLAELVLFAPWGYRNYRLLGRWVWMTSNQGITAYDGWNAVATGASDQQFVRTMPELRQMSETRRSDYLSQRASEFLKQHPKAAVGLAVRKLARTWSPLPLSDQFSSMQYRLLALAYALPFDLLVIAGLINGKLRTPAIVFLLLPAIYLSVVHALSVGSLRYRLPAEPPMAIVAASIVFPTLRRSHG